MALVACRECGNQVSTEAATCPKCGVSKPQPRSDNGKAIAITIGVVVCIVGFFMISGSIQESREADRQAAVQQATATRVKALKDSRQKECSDKAQAMKASYAALLQQGKYWEAKLSLENCPDVLNDASMKEMATGAARLSYLATIDDAKASVDDRITAIQMLRNVGSPADAERVEPLRLKLQAQADKANAAALKRVEAADLARRKKEGVLIGMSQDEVLKSSWGKPQKINRSTYKFGIHEQWVYGGGYLYFENGVLTSIQN